MILWDVNVLVYAFRRDSPFHLGAMESIESVVLSGQPFLACSNITLSFLRLVTNARIFVQPSPIAEAWAFVDWLAEQSSCVEVSIDPMTMGIFKHISLVNQSGGNAIPDDLIAALAIRHDAVLHTADTGFSKYDGLQVEILENAGK